METAETIQTNCKRFRLEAGLTQQEVADGSGVSIDAVRMWEQRKRTPDRDNLRALAKLFDRSVEEFYDEHPSPRQSAPRPEWNVSFKTRGNPPKGYLDELEAVRRKWTPGHLSEHMKKKEAIKKRRK